MKQKRQISTYNSGKVSIYRDSSTPTSFSAKKVIKKIEDMTFIAKLSYEEASCRQQDFEFAEGHGISLEMKIRTRYNSKVDTRCKAVIGNKLYDISYVDDNKAEMWLYLEGEREIAT